jgi:hypothetical protein
MKLLNEKLKYVRAENKDGKVFTWNIDINGWSELPKDLIEQIKKTMPDFKITDIEYVGDKKETPPIRHFVPYYALNTTVGKGLKSRLKTLKNERVYPLTARKVLEIINFIDEHNDGSCHILEQIRKQLL